MTISYQEAFRKIVRENATADFLLTRVTNGILLSPISIKITQKIFNVQTDLDFSLIGYLFGTYAKFSEKLTFLTPGYRG